MRYPARNIVKKNAWIKRGVYKCAGYKRKAHEVRAKDVQIDHVTPIGPLEEWNVWIDRLFCDEDNLQVLCKECHSRKTKCEN